MSPDEPDEDEPVSLTTSLDGGVLSVEVDDPAWATQVKFLAPTIIARLAEVAGARVDQLQVRVDPRNARGARL